MKDQNHFRKNPEQQFYPSKKGVCHLFSLESRAPQKTYSTKGRLGNFSSNEANKVASAQTVKKLYELLGGTKIVISDTQPSPEAGVTILWIDASSTED